MPILRGYSLSMEKRLQILTILILTILKKMQLLKPFIETKVGKKEVKDDSASLTGRIFMSKKKNPVPTNFSFLENFFGMFSI